MIYVPIPDGIKENQMIGNVGRENITMATTATTFGDDKEKAIEYYEAAIKEFEAAKDYFENRKWAIVSHIRSM